MSNGSDDFLDSIESGDSPAPAPSPPAPAVPSAPSSRPAAPPSSGWVIVIPKPRFGLPSKRTLGEVGLVLLLLWALGAFELFRVAAPVAHFETGTLYAELVHDVEKDGKATGPLKADATLAPRLKELDCQWGWMESSDPHAAVMLKGQAPPAVAIVRKGETEAIKVIPVPENGDPIVAAVKALRGKD